MTQDYPAERRAPLSTLAHFSLDGDEESLADPALKILIVDRRGNFSHDIERAARSLEQVPKIVTVAHPTHLLEHVAIEVPDVVLAAPEEMTAAGLRRLAQIHRAAPKTVIALTQGATPISMTEAAACGASEVINYPGSVTKLRNALGRILDTAAAVRGERVVIREVQAPAPAPLPAAPAPAAPIGNARVFTVTSPTGGCGKTFFATNLAAYLAHATGGRVVLIDLDLQFGEVSLALGLRPQRTISELINEENMAESFGDYLVDHSSGYKVLSAPADPFAAELVGPREATAVLECARSLFDYVVVDTPPSLNEVVLAAFDQSRYLVVMATLDVPSLRNLRVFLETIERLKLPADDVSCVLNKAEPDNGIDLQELLRVYPRGFAAVLPYSKEVSRSLNVGQPVIMVDPRAEISVKLLEAGAKLVPANEITNPTWGRSGGRAGRSGWRKDRHMAPSAVPPAPVPGPSGPLHNAPRYEPPQARPLQQAAPAYPATSNAPYQAPYQGWEQPQAYQAPPPPPAAAAPSPQPIRFQEPEEEKPEPMLAQPPQAPQASPQQPQGTWTSPPVQWPPTPVETWGKQQAAGLFTPAQPQRRSWFGRLFSHRPGRHSAPGSASPQGNARSQVTTAAQMQVGPQTEFQTGRNGQGPADAPNAPELVFAGSREAAPETERPAAGIKNRRRPSEAPNTTSRKETRR